MAVASDGVTRPAGTAPRPTDPPRLGRCRALLAWLGERFIYALVRILGRTVRDADAPWLVGPVGSDFIGDRPYDEWAASSGATAERHARDGGLLAEFAALRSDAFEPARVDPRVRHFYEQTAVYRLDMWARSWFPANVALWLLVTTISRKVDQLNFPLDLLETAGGLDSEVILLRGADGRVQATGWYRRSCSTGRAVYSGFYMTTRVPATGRTCVKVVFPMPNGNATVLLEPRHGPNGELELSSAGRGYGDAGFYRLQRIDGDRVRAWRVRTLREHFRVFAAADGTLRCDHRVRFLGLPVLHLHYRMELRRDVGPQ